MTAGPLPDDAAYCAEQVRRHDHDRYLTCLFAPAARRAPLLALYAFNLEVAKTAEVVSEPMLGQIRLQWWRDAIEGIYAGAPLAHAVVQPLAAAVRAHGLTRGHFERLIDAREADLGAQGPANLADLEDYARNTSSVLLWLALEILGEGGDAARAAAESVGIGWALAGLLRAVPFHARRKRLFLPADLLRDQGVKTGDLFELRPSAPLNAVVRQLAARAEAHIAAARRHRAGMPRSVLPALLPATLASGHLARLRRAGYDPFDARVQRPAPARAWRLALASLLGRY